MRRLVNFINRKIASLLGTTPLKNIQEDTQRILSIVENVNLDNYFRDHLYGNVAYSNSKKITRYHKSVFTQNGEDGIIEEIFKRIKTTNKYFVEFGVHGIKNNTTLLLVEDWKGLWIGGDQGSENDIRTKFGQPLTNGQLKYVLNWITKDNIETIFAANEVPALFDFLSIDIDGNDFWVWEAIRKYSPRVVCIEYNATFPPGISWVMAYREGHAWDQTSYFGASLKALEKLGKEKGYELVGCDFSGCNAFFVRHDEDLQAFESPFTAENHYEPPRYFLGRPSGHAQGFGAYIKK